MTARDSVNPAGFLREQLETVSPDLLRTMVKTFAEALMSADADAACGAAYGQRSEERVNSRNGYREREWDIRAGTIELALPKLQSGSYFPDWLLTYRRRAEQALVSVVGVPDLVARLGQPGALPVRLAGHADQQVALDRQRHVERVHQALVGPGTGLRGQRDQVRGRPGYPSGGGGDLGGPGPGGAGGWVAHVGYREEAPAGTDQRPHPEPGILVLNQLADLAVADGHRLVPPVHHPGVRVPRPGGQRGLHRGVRRVEFDHRMNVTVSRGRST
jgi:hypothetical protein